MLITNDGIPLQTTVDNDTTVQVQIKNKDWNIGMTKANYM